MAGLDGIKRKIEPGDPVEQNIYKMAPSQKQSHGIRALPQSLMHALDALKSDDTFLKRVFTKDLLDAYCESKYKEFKVFSQTPTAWEVSMCADV